MSVYTYTGKLNTYVELTWLILLLPVTGLGIGAALTAQDHAVPLVAWIILIATILGMWAITGFYFIRKIKWLKSLRLILHPPGLVVGWEDDRYCVNGDAVNAIMVDCVLQMRAEFPRAEDALRDCVVWFREPSWIQQPSGPGFLARRVAGVQDGQLIVVGWREDLTTSALKHELAHRILQVYAGDPPEEVAHQIMTRLGVL